MHTHEIYAYEHKNALKQIARCSRLEKTKPKKKLRKVAWGVCGEKRFLINTYCISSPITALASLIKKRRSFCPFSRLIRPEMPVLWQVDCKTVGFFLKISKEIGKAWRKSLTRLARPFVWLLARTWIRKNTDCFAVYMAGEKGSRHLINPALICLKSFLAHLNNA